LDVDSDYDGSIAIDGADDLFEDSSCGLVRADVDTREEIAVRETPGSTTEFKLAWTSTKIQVYDAAEEGDPKSSPYTVSAPGTLYVQGVEASTTHGAEVLTLTPADPLEGCSDTIVFTVTDRALVLEHKDGAEQGVDALAGNNDQKPAPLYIGVDADGDADLTFRMHGAPGVYDWTLTGTPVPSAPQTIPVPTSGTSWDGSPVDTGGLAPGSYTLTATLTGAGGVVRKIEFTVVGVEITDWDSDPITDVLTRSIGQKILLKAKVTPTGLTGLGYYWEIPGKAVQGYNISADQKTGHADELSEQERKGASVTYFWVDGDNENDRTVGVQLFGGNVQLAGTDSVAFRVETPTLVASTVTPCPNSDIHVEDMGGGDYRFQCGLKTPGVRGIEWSQTVRTSASFGGVFQNTQLLKSNRRMVLLAGQALSRKSTGGWWLDTADPYGSAEDPPAPAKITINPPDTQDSFGSNDSPAGQLIDNAESLHMKTFEFSNYLMFRPNVPGTQTIFVPMHVFAWGWTGVARRGAAGEPVVKESGKHTKSSPTFVPTTEHARWVDKWTEEPAHPEWLADPSE